MMNFEDPDALRKYRLELLKKAPEVPSGSEPVAPPPAEGEAGVFHLPESLSDAPEFKRFRDGIRERMDALQKEKADLLRQIAAIDEKLAAEKRLKDSITYLPVIFDGIDFNSIRNHLSTLQEAGIKEITLGGTVYAVEDIASKVMAVESDSLTRNFRENQKAFDQYLADLGVTRGKITPESAFGFRDCMKRCVLEGDDRARINNFR